MPPRHKIRIRLRYPKDPPPPPPRTCVVCGEMRQGWDFSTSLDVCDQCRRACISPVRGMPPDFPGFDYRDRPVIGAASTVIRAIEREFYAH